MAAITIEQTKEDFQKFLDNGSNLIYCVGYGYHVSPQKAFRIVGKTFGSDVAQEHWKVYCKLVAKKTVCKGCHGHQSKTDWKGNTYACRRCGGSGYDPN